MPHNLHHFFHAREGEDGVGGRGKKKRKRGNLFPLHMHVGEKKKKKTYEWCKGGREEEREGGKERGREGESACERENASCG